MGALGRWRTAETVTGRWEGMDVQCGVPTRRGTQDVPPTRRFWVVCVGSNGKWLRQSVRPDFNTFSSVQDENVEAVLWFDENSDSRKTKENSNQNTCFGIWRQILIERKRGRLDTACFYQWLKEKESSYVIRLQSNAAPMSLMLTTPTAAQAIIKEKMRNRKGWFSSRSRGDMRWLHIYTRFGNFAIDLP